MGARPGTSFQWLLCCASVFGCARGDGTFGFPGRGAVNLVPVALSPLETMRLLRDRLVSRDDDGARAFLARGLANGSGEKDMDGALRHAKNWVAGRSDFAVLEAEEEGEVAIVIVNKFLKGGRETVDIDPIPLLRQDGTWKVVPHVLALGEDRLRQTPSLAAWYRRRKEELKKELVEGRSEEE